MADVLIATQEHALHEIGERIRPAPGNLTPPAPATLEQLRRAVVAVLMTHIALPPDGGPDFTCDVCHGHGSYLEPVTGEMEHCHCGCPYCSGCMAPLCYGPCETVEDIAQALGLMGGD